MGKILIVDDESGIRNLLYEMLTREGHSVTTLASAVQIFQVLPQVKPDLVLLDLEMPDENGLSLLQRLPLVNGRRVPVVIFSGFLTAEAEKEAYRLGVIDVIHKGTETAALPARINQILAVKHRLLGEPEEKIRRVKILLVDDEEAVLQLLKTFFERHHFTTLIARNGEEAVHCVERERPSVILLDVNMPGMDGILTLRKIREVDPNVGVVMATGIYDAQVIQESTQLGSFAYVLKPFDLQYLELVVLSRLLAAAPPHGSSPEASKA